MEERKILRTILFRDNDLDGKGTEVVLRNARFINLVQVMETAVYKLEQDFKAMWFNGLLNPKQYDKVLITDLCINENTAKLIREINEKHPNFVEVYDHHVTKLKEDWLHVDNTVSATKLVHNSFETMLIETERLDEFVIDYINAQGKEPKDTLYEFIQDEDLGLVIREENTLDILITLVEILRYMEEREND